MVQLDEANKIRRGWEAAGSPPCDHPEIQREYCMGDNTGDRVHDVRGEPSPPQDWEKMSR